MQAFWEGSGGVDVRVHVVLTACLSRGRLAAQIKLMVSSDKPTIAYAAGVKPKALPSRFISAISNCIVILVASIPIAIEIVCTSTLAVGSRRLAESKVIVARLSAIEELAGMTILCSDKTGAWAGSLMWPCGPHPGACVCCALTWGARRGAW